MTKVEYTVRFVTPAFLGNAEQNGQWRTPPFKALLRQWWRVAEVRGRQPDASAEAVTNAATISLGDLHRKEGDLFGRVADQRTTASQVRLRLDWREGDIARGVWNSQQASRFANVTHPEVKDRNDPTKLQPVGSALYLGYGPVDVGNKLKRESAIAPGNSRDLTVSIPASEAERFKDVFRLAHLLGALGSRSRNGWGSLHIEKEGLSNDELAAVLDPKNRPARDWLRRFSREWREALDADWCHAIGKDKDGLLWWRTPPLDRWEDVLKLLAEVKIAFRTQFHFRGGGQHSLLCERHVLAYPITNHSLGAWGKEARSANQVLIKVLPEGEGFVGLVAHLPHGLPDPLARRLSDADRQGLRTREIQVWTRTHQILNEQLTRLL